MNLEPQRLYLGVVDVFATLLPGVVLVFLLQGDMWSALPSAYRFEGLTGNERLAVFVVGSYLVGHLVFLIGAWWLDEFYDWARGHTRNAVLSGAARRGKLSPWIGRVLVWLVFKREDNAAVDRAAAIKREMLKPVQGAAAINTFQWSKAWLTAESPASLEQVQRFEADSKFFRSLVVVLLVLIGVWTLKQQTILVVVAVCLLPLALWRYMDQRLKATNQAYWSVITLVARGGKVALPVAAQRFGEVTHAGGVVFRRRWGVIQYLLVEASANPSEWVLPKGHREEGETDVATAVREVQEETGVWARMVSDVGVVRWTVADQMQVVHFFLMEWIGQGRAKDRDRRRQWIALADLERWSSYAETRELVRRADTVRVAGAKTS
jgi:ADP-ribose pyrophosphatase YjhB (NUDIX family)